MTGQIISHYRILEQLGSGGMGVVYKAEDLKLGRQVALKFLSEELSQQQAWVARFQREARSASALNHPNICTIYEIDEHEGRLFIAMELLEGHSLRDEVDQPLPTERVLELAIQIAEALRAAHAKSIIHRDLKSANIFVTQAGPAKLLDFGLAKLTHAHKERAEAPQGDPVSTATLKDSLTDTGLIIGTVPYMSPEQLLARELDQRTDLFSLGVVLYQMATGRLPFQGNTAPETIMKIARDEPRPMEGVPPELQRITRKCLEKDRQRRYQTAEELLSDLKRLQSGQSPALSMLLRRHWRGLASGFAVLVLAAALLWNPGGWLSKLGIGKSLHIESLAVLPLTNLSGDASQDFFADGMTESLSTELGQIKALKKVISRTSVMRYKGTTKPLRQIAVELGVDGVIEASVLLSGNQVRITAKLIDAASDTQVWAQTYERNLGNILSLQSEVARSIVTGIQTRLTQPEQARLARQRPVNPEAYLAYLKGWYHWLDATPESTSKAMEYFNEAIRLDPNYAEAYAGLAHAWIQRAVMIGDVPAAEALPKARAAAEKSAALDGSLAEVHEAMATVMDGEWNFAGAEKEYRRALELNPSYVQALLVYTVMLRRQGRHQEAIAQARRALELDPLALQANEVLADAYLDAREYDRALEQYLKTLDLYPDHPNLHYYLGWVYVYKGMYGKGIEQIQRSLTLEDADPDLSADLAYIYGVQGRKDEALKILGQLQLFSKQSTVPPEHFALAFIGLGNKDEALLWLEKAYQQHSGVMLWLKVDPRFDSLRKDPRFADLLRRVGL